MQIKIAHSSIISQARPECYAEYSRILISHARLQEIIQKRDPSLFPSIADAPSICTRSCNTEHRPPAKAGLAPNPYISVRAHWLCTKTPPSHMVYASHMQVLMIMLTSVSLYHHLYSFQTPGAERWSDHRDLGWALLHTIIFASNPTRLIPYTLVSIHCSLTWKVTPALRRRYQTRVCHCLQGPSRQAYGIPPYFANAVIN